MSKQKYKRSTKAVLWWGLGIIVVLGLGYLAVSAPKRPTSSITTREVALTCTSDMATVFHLHASLAISVNGIPRAIPANVGIKPGCMNSLHMHDNTGLIHVEAPEKRDFTLGDFFAVWGQPFSSAQLLELTADATHVIRLTVNGKPSVTYENTVLHDGDVIVISYEQKS